MFFTKTLQENYPSLIFIGNKVQLVPSQKHLDLLLDFKLNFNECKQ